MGRPLRKFEYSPSMRFCLLLLCIATQSSFGQEQDSGENPVATMSEDPQVLAPSETDSTSQVQAETGTEASPEVLPPPQTEAISSPTPTEPSVDNAAIDTLTDNTSNLETGNLPSTETKSDLQKKTGVVSEEELLKTKNKKAPKIKSIKPTQSELYIQQKDRYKIPQNFKNLKLNDVIEQGLRKNYDQQIKDQKQELSDLTFKGIKSAFWMPNLSITLTTDEQKISSIKTSDRKPTLPHSSSPSGRLGLTLGDYTVFNWGKDYAIYLNNKSLYERNTEVFKEGKRELKLDLINSYFSLLATKNIENIRQEQLRKASFVYRLNKEKITIGKTTKQDYYQARSEYLKAQNLYHEAKMTADETDETLAYQIADEAGSKYFSIEALDYRMLKMTIDEALKIADKNNPNMLTKKVLAENAEREYDVALKDNMPLPKFTINLGAYNKRFGPSTNSTLYETYSNSGNIELVASINSTWSLAGANGFLNSNKLAASRISREIAKKEFEQSIFTIQSYVRQTYKTIISLQNQLVILEARLPSLQKTFDTVMENYLAGRATFYDFSMALDEISNTKIFYEQTKLEHLEHKLKLAKILGVEDFPGENFEQLAIRIKGK